MDNNLQNTHLDDQKMEKLRKRTKLSKYIMIAGGVCLGIVAVIFLASGETTLSTDRPEGVAVILFGLAGFALLFAGIAFKQKASEAQKHIANNYARSVLGRVMDRLDTFPGFRIPEIRLHRLLRRLRQGRASGSAYGVL